MAWLHRRAGRGEILPLDLSLDSGIPPSTALDVHHTRNPWGGPPRDCDAAGVLLDHTQHMWLEEHPRVEQKYWQVEGVWAAYHYWL